MPLSIAGIITQFGLSCNSQFAYGAFSARISPSILLESAELNSSSIFHFVIDFMTVFGVYSDCFPLRLVQGFS
jgi:hypothetical protein